MKSPLRYPGGKAKQASLIFKRFPDSPKRYIEPMVGGGSLFFYAQERSYALTYWINDLDSHVADFWNVAADFRGNARMVELMLEALKEDPFVPEDIYTRLKYPAFQFFFRNRCSFSGTTRAGGWSRYAGKDHPHNRFTVSSINKLKEMPNACLSTVRTHLDVFDILNPKFRTPTINPINSNDFLYIDPPYVTAKKLYGPSGSLHDFDHARLAAELKETKAKFLLSYDNCDIVKDLYKWANIEEVTFNRSMSKKKQGKEVLISNYEYDTI